VAAPVEVDHDSTATLDFNCSGCLHELPEQPLRLDLLETVQARRQPAAAPVGDDRQHRIQICIQTDLAGERVQVEETDARSEPVFDSVVAGIIQQHLSRGETLLGQNVQAREESRCLVTVEVISCGVRCPSINAISIDTSGYIRKPPDGDFLSILKSAYLYLGCLHSAEFR